MDETKLLSTGALRNNVYDSFVLDPGSRQIRVLDVFESDLKSMDQPLRANLRVIDLDQNVLFTALSYVWGCKSHPPKTLTCDGSVINLTDNAYEALVQLRQCLGSYTIWIDAICINQDNNDEKAHQIGLMDCIYAGAQTVYVWLGIGTTQSDRAMDFLSSRPFFNSFFVNGEPDQGELARPKFWRAFASWYPELVRRYWHTRKSMKQNSGRNVLCSTLRGDKSEPLLLTSDMSHLLSRQWIRRIWTYQEILLANNPVVICGDRHVPWTDLALMIIYIDYVFVERVPDVELMLVLPTWKNLALSRERFANRKSSQVEPDVLHAGTTSTRLLRYQAFVHRICSLQNKLLYTTLFLTLVCLSVAAFIFPTIYDSRRLYNALMHQIQAEFAAEGNPMTDAELLAACRRECEAAGGCQTVRGLDFCSFPAYKPYIALVVVPLVLLALFAMSLLPTKVLRVKTFLGTGRLQSLRRDVQDDLADALCTRNATNSEDMAFGLRAILKGLLDHDLPTVDHNVPLSELYHGLTMDLLRAGKSMQILLAASMHHIKGLPSWVPDWSQDFLRFWTAPWSTHLDATPGSVAFWNIDKANQQILMVRGRRMCTVSDTGEFRPTSITYEVSQKMDHLHNLGIMLRFASNRQGQWPVAMRRDKELFLCNLFDDRAGKYELDGLHLLAYCRFVQEYCNKSSTTALEQLLSNSGMSVRQAWQGAATLRRLRVHFADILKVHIMLCNNMVDTKRKVFFTNDMKPLCAPHHYLSSEIVPYFTAHRHPKFCTILPYEVPLLHSLMPQMARNRTEGVGKAVSTGICNSNVEVGDQVVLIAGLSIPLCIRATSEDTVQLISPAHVAGLMRGKGWFCTPRYGDTASYEEIRIS